MVHAMAHMSVSDTQGIEHISGLDECQKLEGLWLMENHISRISNLDHLTALKQLFLYSNHITVIANLDRLVNLEVGCREQSDMHGTVLTAKPGHIVLGSMHSWLKGGTPVGAIALN